MKLIATYTLIWQEAKRYARSMDDEDVCEYLKEPLNIEVFGSPDIVANRIDMLRQLAHIIIQTQTEMEDIHLFEDGRLAELPDSSEYGEFVVEERAILKANREREEQRQYEVLKKRLGY